MFAGQNPAIAIIIDDMGNQRSQGMAALELQGAITFAFLPYTPYAEELAEKAHRLGKEVMLHLPMDAYEGNSLGPGALTLHMTEVRFKQTLTEDLMAIPHVSGVNNHMGSLLTRHPGAMRWMMETLQEWPDLYFLDSRTTHYTVAQQMAVEHQVPNTRRDVFLDNLPSPESIEKQFALLLDLARQQGYAVAIGHPYPQTVQVLRRLLENLNRENVQLISASAMVDLQQRRKLWPELSSPSLKVAKSSKQLP